MTTRSVVVVAVLGVLAAAAAVTAVATSDHATGKAATIALAVPTGLAYIGSGLVARRRRPNNGTGVLMILAGFAWFFAALPSANDGYLFTLGLALNGVFIGFLGHLFLAYPGGKLGSRVDRVITAALYAVVAILPTVALILDDGDINKVACEGSPCPENVLASGPSGDIALAIFLVYAIGTGALSLAVAVRLLRRWRRASPALRTALNPILVTAGALIVGYATQIATSFVSSGVSRAINWFVLAAMLAVPLAFLYGLLRPRLTASARRLVAELSEERRPEQVQAVLQRELRDPTLAVGFRDDRTDGYVGVDARPLELPPGDTGRAVTRVGEHVLVHDSSLRDQPELDEVVGAAQIALERGLSLRSLEASRVRVDALLDAVPDNVYRVAADGVFIDAHVKRSSDNPDGLVYPVGVPAAKLVGMRIEDVTPDFSNRLYDGIRRALATDEVVTVEYMVDTPSGPRHAEERIVRSGPDEVVGISRDVTERKRHEQQLRALAQEQAALSRVAVAVAASRNAQPVFDVVTAEVGKLFHAQGANLVRFEEDPRTALVVGAWDEAQSHMQKGHRITLDGPTPLAIVRRTGAPAWVESFEEMPGETAAWIRSLGVGSAVAAPVDVGGRRWGAVVVTSAERGAFDTEAEKRLAKFANLVALAIANTEAHEELTASRARIVRAGDEERQRLERNLHDGAQQRLVALSLALRLVQSKLEDPQAARAPLASASEQLAQALEELRELARGIHPAILSDRGLVPALEALAARAPLPVEIAEVKCCPLPPDVEAAAYYVVSESLTNVAKYADANAAHVRIERRNGRAVVEVEDDGIGGADPSRGTGLRGLADRVEALDGHLTVSSDAGRGTCVRAEIPLDGDG